MSTVSQGDLQKAYQIWQPSQSYSFKDFTEDWGPGGYYGPVKSYRIGRPEHVKDGDGHRDRGESVHAVPRRR